jgi:hypothetical protein
VNLANPEASDAPRGSPSSSRILVVFLVVWIAGFIALARWCSMLPPSEGDETVVSPFKPLDGEWTGEWAVYPAEDLNPPPDWRGQWIDAWTDYAPAGEPIERRRERRAFLHLTDDKAFRQEGRIRPADADPDGPAETLIIHTSTFRGEELRRRAFVEDGRRLIQFLGVPDGEAIVWSTFGPRGVEAAREWVEGDVYLVRGVRIEGGAPSTTPIFYIGLFRRAP